MTHATILPHPLLLSRHSQNDTSVLCRSLSDDLNIASRACWNRGRGWQRRGVDVGLGVNVTGGEAAEPAEVGKRLLDAEAELGYRHVGENVGVARGMAGQIVEIEAHVNRAG